MHRISASDLKAALKDGGEIAAWVAQELFCDLDAPVMRVGALDSHVPYAPEIERVVLPQTDDIDAAARRLLAF